MNGQTRIGTIAFSPSVYWSWIPTGTIELANSNNYIYSHLLSYKSKLEWMGVTINDITLITKIDIENLINDGESFFGNINIKEKIDENMMPWLHTTTYWTCTGSTNGVWFVDTDANLFKGNYIENGNYDIRPVIEVLASEI